MPLGTHIDTTALDSLSIGGRGGKETHIGAILPGWRRVGGALHDYELDTAEGTLQLELKKQANLQWFDVGKYFELSAQSRLIWLLFVVHDDGVVTLLLAVRLGDFTDFLCSTPKFQKLGWNNDVFQTAARFKTLYPALQFKVKAEVLSLYRAYPELFELIYSRQNTIANCEPATPNHALQRTAPRVTVAAISSPGVFTPSHLSS